MKQAGSHQSFTLLHASFLLGLFFDPEDGGGMFARNVGLFPMNYTALYSRIYWTFIMQVY
jgi:hypothetical protein